MNTPVLQAYNNDPNLKLMLLEEMAKHREADELIRGTYGQVLNGVFRGCAIGCAINSLNTKLGLTLWSSDHKKLAEYLQLPVGLLYVIDSLFEYLPQHLFYLWSERALSAIQTGIDYSYINYSNYLDLLIERSFRADKDEVVKLADQLIETLQKGDK